MARIRLVIGSNPTHARATRRIAEELSNRLETNGHEVRIMAINPQNTLQYVIRNYLKRKIPLSRAVRQLLEIKEPYRYLTQASMPARYEEPEEVPYYIQLDAAREHGIAATRINGHAHIIPIKLAYAGKERPGEETKAGANLFKKIQEQLSSSPKKMRHLQDLVAEEFRNEKPVELPQELTDVHMRMIESTFQKIAGIVGRKTREETKAVA